MDLALPRINKKKYLPSRNNEEEGATNGFEQDEANRLEQELSMLNRQKTELIESSRGCFLICYRLLRPFQVHLRIFSKYKKCVLLINSIILNKLILIGLTNHENRKLIFRFCETTSSLLISTFLNFSDHYGNGVFSPRPTYFSVIDSE